MSQVFIQNLVEQVECTRRGAEDQTQGEVSGDGASRWHFPFPTSPFHRSVWERKLLREAQLEEEETFTPERVEQSSHFPLRGWLLQCGPRSHWPPPGA